MKKNLSHICFILLHFFALIKYVDAQDYDSYFIGNPSDAFVSVLPGVVLAGGGRDNDDAMRWMLRRAEGGDVLVLRASGSDGYNTYFHKELGITMNSVESIVFRSRRAASNPIILDKIKKAEIIFIAGGDQSKYHDLWRNTPLEEAIQNAVKDKTKIVGGTSAGMMILGGIAYLPQQAGITGIEALSNPYHQNMELLLTNNSFGLPLFENIVFDTHFDNRSRDGRIITFMARSSTEKNIRAKAIACNEQTAICIDESDIAYIFGRDGSTNQYVYFLQTNCEENGLPILSNNRPLHWNIPTRNSVIQLRFDADSRGINKFDIRNWTMIEGHPTVEYWNVFEGQLQKSSSTNTMCTLQPTSSNDVNMEDSIRVYPNPTRGIIHFPKADTALINDINGKLLMDCVFCTNLDLKDINGTIILKHYKNGKYTTHTIVVHQ